MGKNKKKGKMRNVRKGGEGLEEFGRGPGPVEVEQGGPGHEEADAVAYKVVEFIYSEQPLMHYERVDPRSVIPATFVMDSLAACLANWSLVLPDVRIDDLLAHPFPAMPEHGGTFCDWSGLIHVELQHGRLESGLCTQVASLRREVLGAEAALVDKEAQGEVLLNEAVEKAMERMQVVLKKELRGQHKSIRQLKDMASRQQQEIDLLKSENIHLNSTVTALQGSFHHLEDFITTSALEHGNEVRLLTQDVNALKLLANHVKRRTSLEKARACIIEGLKKREPKFGENWSKYFDEFSMDDWKEVFVAGEGHILTHDAKQLLKKGSLLANAIIHNMDASIVLEGIMAPDVEGHRDAWLWVLEKAFPMISEDEWTTMKGKFSEGALILPLE